MMAEMPFEDVYMHECCYAPSTHVAKNSICGISLFEDALASLEELFVIGWLFS